MIFKDKRKINLKKLKFQEVKNIHKEDSNRNFIKYRPLKSGHSDCESNFKFSFSKNKLKKNIPYVSKNKKYI